MRLMSLLSPQYGNIFESMTVLISYDYITTLWLQHCNSVYTCAVVRSSSSGWYNMLRFSGIIVSLFSRQLS